MLDFGEAIDTKSAQDAAATFLSTQQRAVEAVTDAVSAIDTGHVIIILSVSGTTPCAIAVAKSTKAHGATVIGMANIRRDSPNRKRFTKQNHNEDTALRSGFDLSPLFSRLHEIGPVAL